MSTPNRAHFRKPFPSKRRKFEIARCHGLFRSLHLKNRDQDKNRSREGQKMVKRGKHAKHTVRVNISWRLFREGIGFGIANNSVSIE